MSELINNEIGAKLYGEDIAQLPLDLYIPPEALEVYLESFEGPLDLLLYLIRKDNIDVLDIPMANLTSQYINYVEQMKTINIELAADYLLMSAMLIEIKSRLLLPKPENLEEEDDPRADLVRKLIEYEQMKSAAEELNEMPQVGRDTLVANAFFETKVSKLPPEVNVDDLYTAWVNVIKRAKQFEQHKIAKSELSVREHMTSILRSLKENSLLEFSHFFNEEKDPIPKLVVCFLAILELSKERLIKINQQEPCSPLYIQLEEALMAEDNQIKKVIEVALLTNNQPLSIDDFQKMFDKNIERSTVRMLLDEIKQDWQDKSLELIQVAHGYRFQSKLEYSEFLKKLNPDRVPKYSRAVLEVLAIIAYRQPVTRGDIEKIRGVSLNPNSLKQLIEREWVDIIGQKEVPGRPSLYATTKYFLDDFGLKTLAQLPEFKDLEQSPLNQTVDNESPEPSVQEVSDLKEEE